MRRSESLPEQLNEDPIAVLTKAIENTKPLVETRSRRIGGACISNTCGGTRKACFGFGSKVDCKTVLVIEALEKWKRSWLLSW